MNILAPVGARWRIVALLVMCGFSTACTGTGANMSSAAPNGAAMAPQGYAAGGLRMVSDLPPPANSSGGSEQAIAPDDVLEVDVFQVDNLDRTVQVDASGRISLPLIGAIAAQGKSIRQLEEEIESRYGSQYLQSPDVTIFLKESARQRVTVDGEVARSGIYPVSSSATLMDAIALAGGLNGVADATKVYVYRDAGDGTKLVANYNVTQIRNGSAKNPRIFGGDVVVVFTSQSKIAINNLKEALGIASNAARIAVIP